MQKPKMLTIAQTAKEFNLPKNFVRQAVLDGRIVHVKAGKKHLINAQKVEEWLNAGDSQISLPFQTLPAQAPVSCADAHKSPAEKNNAPLYTAFNVKHTLVTGYFGYVQGVNQGVNNNIKICKSPENAVFSRLLCFRR